MSVRATERLVGDVVVASGLSNSPKMVVQAVDIEAKLVTAVWFSDDHKGQIAVFPASAKEDRASLEEYKKMAKYQVEVQIKTIIQNAWSSLDHKINYKHTLQPELKRAVYRLSALFDIADSEFIRIREEKSKQDKIIEDVIKDEQDKVSRTNVSASDDEGINKKQEAATLDVLTFHKFMEIQYKNYLFYANKTEYMLQELQALDPELKLSDLLHAFEHGKTQVEDYVHSSINIYSMNPYTELRHIMYLFNKDVYTKLLLGNQRYNFDIYLEKQVS